MSHDRSRPARRRRVSNDVRRHFPPFALTATLAFVALVLALVLLARPANAASRSFAESYDVGSARTLALNIPFGDVTIEGVDGGPVRVRVEADCDGHSQCDRFLESMRLESKHRGGALRLALKGTRGPGGWDFDGWDDGHGRETTIDIDITVEVPRSLALDLNVGAGEVEITGMRRDLSIDIGAGELAVRMEERTVRSIRVDVAIGEVQIHQGGRTREYARVIGGPVRWSDGKGSSEIDVNLGAGEVDVTLE